VADLEEIAGYISRDNPNRAVSFTEELGVKCRVVAAIQELFPPRLRDLQRPQSFRAGVVSDQRPPPHRNSRGWAD
jgi:plasmid stabilization system protein ParE